MIGFLKGTVEYVTEDTVLLEVSGVGFEVKISTSTAGALPGKGKSCMLYTFLAVKEDDLSLYGFLKREELELFKSLISVSGVGPKGAQAILAVLTPEDLRFAIMSGDAKAISRAPGVGGKTAQRIILELKGKVADIGGFMPDAEGSTEGIIPAAGRDDSARDEAVAALTALGYSATESYRAVRDADAGENPDAETLLKAALKKLI
ncbi:MAG: Holliday junction branch migration protein RuvA [Lachnospiraceae bacterium]|nr:Holliday junction branch migration protein RuvA [Lachnospiraceae bacterium]